MLSLNFLLASVVIFITGVQANPTIYPEIIPGPGLPSLESLNLTSKNLYTMKPQFLLEPRSSNSASDVDCTSFANSNTNLNDALACYNYLAAVNMRDQTCAVSGDNVRFVEAGEAMIGGSNLHQTPGDAASSCWDVSVAAQGILQSCTNGGRVGGIQAANGNGNLIVGVYNANLK
ncbi:hypothetical protein CPB83DRAFT_943197 [Crepidotus variabilis]|uniref:Ecp2 effector protein domain-containing protein n=1 Tax=Crepidotus variabilis TaxID=179855 RepID=A0A9P6EP35_9AGAR|nr:hypothetical protein CPB83DRAFT_943197 [Crepidotus variabilis]